MDNELPVAAVTPSACLAAFLVGVVLHVCVFRVGEWHRYTVHIIFASVVAAGTATAALTVFGPEPGRSAVANLKPVSLALGACVSGVFASMLVYRALLHRLCRFPGPFLARLSNLHSSSLDLKGRLFDEIRALHGRYGDVVRVGPSTLSITDPKAYHLIHSNQSRCTKGPWYDIMYPIQSLHLLRDPVEHAQRRKAWDKGLGSKALRDYEPKMRDFAGRLFQRVGEQRGEPIDITRWFNFFSFDVMGDLAFHKSFNMLRDGVVHSFMGNLHSNMGLISGFRHLVWMFPIFMSTPGVNHEHVKLQKWLTEQVTERRERVIETPDLFSWILDDFERHGSPSKQDMLNLNGDAQLIVVAGSDTTAATLTCLFFELARKPAVAAKLRSELDAHFAQNATTDVASLSTLAYLGACIDECLRLYPPVPSGLQRLTPPEGLQLDQVFIPGNTIVQMPTYTLHRDERSFVQPDEFIPERWTTRPELVKNASVYSPFGMGRYSCAGKQLALAELRYVTSHIIHQYHVRLAPGQTDEAFLHGLQDFFTMALPPLELVFDKVAAAGG